MYELIENLQVLGFLIEPQVVASIIKLHIADWEVYVSVLGSILSIDVK